jgi:hypothetical protein
MELSMALAEAKAQQTGKAAWSFGYVTVPSLVR